MDPERPHGGRRSGEHDQNGETRHLPVRVEVAHGGDALWNGELLRRQIVHAKPCVRVQPGAREQYQHGDNVARAIGARGRAAHSRAPMKRSRSTQREAYPHSLSYQPHTFTSVPSMTLVVFASSVQEYGLPVKSTDTRSSSVTATMPLSGPSAAARNAPFTASIVVARSTSTTRSVNDTSGVGTRTEMPSILPFTSGMTSPVAFAAPVVVGIWDSAAARARRRSLCGRSRMF